MFQRNHVNIVNTSNLGFPVISWRTYWGNGLTFCMLMYPDHLQNWLDNGHSWLIFSCDQAALQMVFSVCLSVRPSVRPSVRLSVTPFSPCSHHRIIMKFSGVITMVESDVHAKGQGQRSKVKVISLYHFWIPWILTFRYCAKIVSDLS